MKKLFGTDGIRGIAGTEPVTLKTGAMFGYAAALFCKDRGLKPVIVIGRDTRRSGKELEQAICSGVIAGGGTVYCAGIIPTPGVSFLTKDMDAGAGIVVSASHNPWQYNGFKIFSNRGTKLSKDDENDIEQIIDSGKAESEPSFEDANKKKITELNDSLDRYAAFLKRSIPDKFSLDGIKIIMDCANGATYRVAPMVFKQTGAEVKAMFDTPDGTNINRDCGSQYTNSLAAEVTASGADIGLAFDGDGDRLVAVDEKGNTINGDQILLICAHYLQKCGELTNNVVVSTVMSNIGLKVALEKMGIQHVATDVGDRNVFEEMVKRGAILGGEDSGHIIMAKYHSTGDGILSALQLIRAVKELGQPLSTLSELMTIFPQVTVNVNISHKPDLDSINGLSSVIEKIEHTLGKEGRVLVRYSGTEPVCRIMVEGKDINAVKNYAQSISDVIRKNIGTDN